MPDGPWNIDGKLDPNFRDWLAGKWLKQYGGDIHTQRANVLSHFKKDPANLPIRWEQYQGEYLNRYQNAQILTSRGIAVKPEYQETLIVNQRALTAELPQEMKVMANLDPALPATVEPITRGLVESVEPVGQPLDVAQEPPFSPPVVAEIPTTKDFVKNEDGQIFKVFKAPAPVEEPITPEQWEGVRARIAALTGNLNFGKTKHREDVADKKTKIEVKQTYMEKLNSWIVDPLLRDEAMKQVWLSGNQGDKLGFLLLKAL